MDRKQYLNEELSAVGLITEKEQLDQLYRYYELVIQKNEVMNLTAITDYEEFVKKHFIDSLMLYRKTKFRSGMKIVDIGTGAGFPGIPIKIMFPEVNMVLLDSLNKRILFLQEVIRELGLKQIGAFHARAEEFAHRQDYREKYDLCVSRAVANLTTLAEYCIPYVTVGGEFVAYKSGHINEELEKAAHAIDLLGGKTEEVESFILPGSDMERTLIHIRKTKQTPKKYPRFAGKPAKEPLE